VAEACFPVEARCAAVEARCAAVEARCAAVEAHCAAAVALTWAHFAPVSVGTLTVVRSNAAQRTCQLYSHECY
jgi:hypothetical protein